MKKYFIYKNGKLIGAHTLRERAASLIQAKGYVLVETS